ncbi:6652_t:CDS:2, partial [Paraglomus occultum]
MRPLTKFVSIAHVHRWTLQDVKDFIFYVERLQYEETHCKRIDELNLTQMCLLNLSKEKLDCWVKLQWINPALADILESASINLKERIMLHATMLLGRARFQKYHDTIISMLHDDIRFGVDIIEHEFQGDLRAFCSRVCRLGYKGDDSDEENHYGKYRRLCKKEISRINLRKARMTHSEESSESAPETSESEIGSVSSSAKSVNYGNRESIDYSGSSDEDDRQERRMTDEMTDSGNDKEIEETGSDSDGVRGNSDADSRFDSDNLAVDDNDAADKNYRLKRRLTETTTTRVTRQMSMRSRRVKSRRGRPRKDESRNGRVDKKTSIPVVHVFAFK